jgi:pimeloyl-ACP methyl ester carboxylesterase
MEPRTHRLPLPNATGDGKHEVEFYDWGNPDAQKTVICVHGLTRNARDFDLLAPALAARDRRVIAISMPGRGNSEWLKNPMGYTYPAYVADCIAIMDNFHLRQVEWVGTSMGGIIGMLIASGTDRIRKLVLNDIGIHLPASGLRRIYDYVTTMPREFRDRAEASAYLSGIFSGFGIRDLTLWEQFVTHSLLENPYRLACDPAILEPLREPSKNFTEVADTNLAQLWEKVDVPALVLHGAESDVLQADTIAGMRKINPRTESITFQNVGHAPALATAEQIRPVVDWLTGSPLGMLASGL